MFHNYEEFEDITCRLAPLILFIIFKLIKILYLQCQVNLFLHFCKMRTKSMNFKKELSKTKPKKFENAVI